MIKSESSPQSSTMLSQPSTPQPSNKEVATKDSLLNDTCPSFGQFEYKQNIVSMDNRHRTIDVRLHTKIDRGFFLADNDWTCYRRNYFQVSGSFSLEGVGMLYDGQEIPCLARDLDGKLCEIEYFMLGISARLSDCDKQIQIIQHTPKRDKGPQSIPAPRPIRPGGNIGFSSVGSSQSIVTFERLQFKNATANNGKRRAAQQYYVIVVELLVKLANGNVLTVATANSSPLVVRGRSPGHYADADNGVVRQPYRHHSSAPSNGTPTTIQHHHPYQRPFSAMNSNTTTPTTEYPPSSYPNNTTAYSYGNMPPPPPPPPTGHSYPSPSIPMMQHHYLPSVHERTHSNDSTYPEKVNTNSNTSSPYYWQRQDVYQQDQHHETETRLRMASNQSNTSVESTSYHRHDTTTYYTPQPHYGHHVYQPMNHQSLPPPPPPLTPNNVQDHYYQPQQYDWRNTNHTKMPSYPYESHDSERHQQPSSATTTTVSSPLSSSNREATIVK